MHDGLSVGGPASARGSKNIHAKRAVPPTSRTQSDLDAAAAFLTQLTGPGSTQFQS
jgi:hypothetical protein